MLKEYIYPKIKILSDREKQFLHPDFVGDAVDQSRRICDILIRELNFPTSIEYKVPFWITYRKLVKNQLVKYRSNCVEEIKKEYFKGRWLLYILCLCLWFLISMIRVVVFYTNKSKKL